jgi:hypothetical protein
MTVVPGAFLGRVRDSNVFVAVVPGDRTVQVYACDGVDLRDASVDQWFRGPFDGVTATTLRAGRFAVTLRPEAGGFVGDFVLPDGRALPFTAAPAAEDSVLLDAEVRDPATGAVTRDGNVIVLGAEQRGALVPARPRKCRVVLTTGADGSQNYVTVCN